MRKSVLSLGLAGLVGLFSGCSPQIDEEEDFAELSRDFKKNYVAAEVEHPNGLKVVYYIPRQWVPKGMDPREYVTTKDYERKCKEYKEYCERNNIK